MRCPTCGEQIAMTGWEPSRDSIGRLTKRKHYGICTTCNTRQFCSMNSGHDGPCEPRSVAVQEGRSYVR